MLKYKIFMTYQICNYKFSIDKYYNYYIINIVTRYLYFIHLLRNEFVCFVNHFMVLRLTLTINSLIIKSSLYSRIFFSNLFVELISYYLAVGRWRNIDILVTGARYNFFYLFRYLYYSYNRYSQTLLKISRIHINMRESYGTCTYKKYPKRRRRFKRVI